MQLRPDWISEKREAHPPTEERLNLAQHSIPGLSTIAKNYGPHTRCAGRGFVNEWRPGTGILKSVYERRTAAF